MLKILNATINGFGKWTDYKIDFSQKSATCIFGENESGKSTIQRFILFMLFGLTPKQRAFYRPKTSGKMGGRMTLDHPETGSIVIERFDEVKNGAAVCLTPDGEVHDEVWLQKILNGMTAKTYQSIFSFSALDLTEIRNMKDEDLGEVLLGIGLTGSNSIYSIERRLDMKIGELFKPTGKKPVINQQIDSLKTIDDSLQSFREKEASYRNKQEALMVSQRELSKHQQDLKVENNKAISIEKRLHAFAFIQDYHQLKDRLAAYPENIPFPESGVERLEKWKEALLPLQSEWNVLNENEITYTDRLKRIEKDLHSESIQNEAIALLDNQIEVDSSMLELRKMKNTMLDNKRRIDEEMEHLNIGIQKEEMENLELPFYLENNWNQIRNENEQQKLEKEQLLVEHNQLEQEQNFLLNQIQQLENQLLTDNQVVELHDRVRAFSEYHLMEKLKQETKSGKKAWDKSKAAKSKKTSSIFIGSILLALLSGIGAFVADVPWLFMVMIVAIAFGTGQWLMSKRSVNEVDRMFQTDSQQSAVLVTEAEKVEAENLLELHHKNKNELTAFQEQEKLGRVQFIKWTEKKKQLDEKARRLEQQIHQQYENYPYLERVEVSYWPEFFHKLNQISKLLRERQKHVKQAAVLEEEIRVFKQKVDRFLVYSGIDIADKSDEDKLHVIRKMIKTQDEKLQEYEHYCNLLNELKDKYQELKQKMQTYEIEIKQLYEIAEVDTEELFYSHARMTKERNDLKIELEKTVAQLIKILPQGSFQQYTNNTTTEEELKIMQQQIAISVDRLEEQVEMERETIAAIRAELAAMESSESYSNSLHRYEMEAEQLKSMAKEWSVLKTAKEMLSETKRDYRDKYLTKVIEVTTKYFNELTGNRYVFVYAPTENHPFQVETCDNIRYTVNELSQGTIDQLYVSLRLAISEIMSEKHGLPFIIDDAFVHFDAVRTKRMISMLNQTAEKQQVILFTCKEEIAAVSTMKRIDLTGNLYV